MKTNKPAWWEIILGVVLMLGAAVGGYHLVTTPELQGTYAWAAVGLAGLAGMWLCVPMRAQALWHEIRAALPILKDPPTDDGHNHG